MTQKQAYPLHWPENWPRTKAVEQDRFKTTITAAIGNVEDSLRRFATDTGRKVENVVVSSNFSLGDRNPRDSGVAVYFSWDGITTCIAVDRYRRIEANLQAIHHCIEAERTKMRHGGLNLVRAAFRGYAALPPPGAARDWRDVLELHRDGPITLEIAEMAFRHLARKRHPDAGGSDSAMADLNAAIAAARKELS